MDSTIVVRSEQQPALSDLAVQINAEHAACVAAVNQGLRHGLEAGHLLLQAKRQCPHGAWKDWLTANFDGSERTAQLYMRVAKHWPEIEAKAQGSALSLDGAVKLLTKSQPPLYQTCRPQLDDLKRRLADADSIETALAIHNEAKYLVERLQAEAFALSGAAQKLNERGKVYPGDLFSSRAVDGRVGLPSLRPGHCHFACDDGAMVEITPVLQEPDFAYVGLFRGLFDDDPDGGTVEFMPRGLRREAIPRLLKIWGFRALTGWRDEPAQYAADGRPWYMSDDDQRNRGTDA